MRRIYSILLFVFLFAACEQKQGNQPRSETSSSITIDKIKLTDLDGQPLDMKQYVGKTVFVNYWATWCKPCRQEMPSIQNAMAILKDKNIEFLFASDEAKDEIEAFSAENNYAFKFVTADNLEELNIMGLPTTFIFDENGKLVFSEMGARKWDSPESITLIKKIANP